jgi:hypothetical protein
MKRALAAWSWRLVVVAACTSAASHPASGDGGAADAGAGRGGRDGGTARDAAFDAHHAADAATDRDARALRDGQVSDDAGAADGGGDVDAAAVCADPMHGFDVFDDTCASAADCALVQRTLNCCGTQAVASVRHSAAAAFMAAAAVCDARLPVCGCATYPAQADDLTKVDDTHPYATVSCMLETCTTSGCIATSRCRTSFAPSVQKTACGPNGLSCDARTEVCVQREPVGPAIVYECKPIPQGCQERRDCACVATGLCTGGFNVCSDIGPNTVDCMCPMCQ